MPRENASTLAPAQKAKVPSAQTLPADPTAQVTPASPDPGGLNGEDEENDLSGLEPEVIEETPRSWVPTIVVFLALAVVGAVVAHFASKELEKNIKPQPVLSAAGSQAIQEANYLRIGWQREAYQVLQNFTGAKEIKDKLPLILNGTSLAPRVEAFYDGDISMDADTSAEAFSVFELSMEDRKRGLFMMIYDQPPQFRMKEFFRPLASLEVQYGIEEADMLLSTVARAGNFAMEPLRVHAFFKRTPQGLKLDWELFIQTKYRTLRQFVNFQSVGSAEVFRVLVVEDVPDQATAVAGTRTYRIEDPANPGDHARILVPIDSEVGRALSKINWLGTKDKKPLAQTATIELQWTGNGDKPELVIGRFLCWEFLGLGGDETTRL